MLELPRLLDETDLWSAFPRVDGEPTKDAIDLGGGISFKYHFLDLYYNGNMLGYEVTIFYKGEEQSRFKVDGEDYEELAVREINNRARDIALKNLFKSHNELEERVAKLEKLLLDKQK